MCLCGSQVFLSGLSKLREKGALMRILVFALGIMLLCGGCITVRKTSLDYTHGKMPSSPLQGKLICLDPGHGGDSSGAVGPKGLKEKDVNLREAFFLKEMLEKAGATVVMTRTGDSDPGIVERATFNRQKKTDLFVSMHHNANAQNDRTMNRTESFYHWKDNGGPSEDAARLIHREMQGLLKLPDSKVYVCWAYGVLRENSYPAVLVEPSYLANPDEEKRLRDEKYLRSIAGAYFRGIDSFFSGGRPEVSMPEAIDVSPEGVIHARIVRPENSALVDAQGIRVELDREPLVNFFYDAGTGELEIHLPVGMAPARHELLLAARNLAGHTSFVARRMFETKGDIRGMAAPGKVLFQGILRDKVIIVDPQGGDGEPVCTGPMGLRASDANLKTALYLEDYLKRCGAKVSLTRRTDREMDNVARVAFGLESNPDIFLTVGHRLPERGMNEKPGTLATRIGARWDNGLEIGKKMIYQMRQTLGTGAALGDVNSREPLKSEVHGWSSWEVMHAAQKYTAVYVCPMMFDASGVEERLSASAGCRKEALAILYGLLANFGLDDRNMASISGTVVSKDGKPVLDAIVRLDDGLLIQTEQDGRFPFKFLPAGSHEIYVIHSDFKPEKMTVELKEREAQEIKVELAP